MPQQPTQQSSELPEAPNSGRGYSYFGTSHHPGFGWWARLPYINRLGKIWKALAAVGVSAGSVTPAILTYFKLIPLEAALISAAFIGAIILIAVSLALMVRSSDVSDEQMHWIIHQSRDALAKIQRHANSRNVDAVATEVVSMYERLVNDVAAYYRHRADDSSLNCCIRLASETSPTAEIEFRTVARSRGMNEGRKRKTQPIKESQGIVKFFQERDFEGVLIIDDLAAAIEQKIWIEMVTDKLYAADVKYVMVCPINGYYSDKIDKKMLGLIYLVTPTRPLPAGYWASLKAIADLLGLVCAVSLNLQEQVAANESNTTNFLTLPAPGPSALPVAQPAPTASSDIPPASAVEAPVVAAKGRNVKTTDGKKGS